MEDLECIGCIAVASRYQIHLLYVDKGAVTKKDLVSADKRPLVDATKLMLPSGVIAVYQKRHNQNE